MGVCCHTHLNCHVMLWISLTLQFYLNHLSILNNHCNELFASSCLLQTALTNSPVTVQQLRASQICQLPNLHPLGVAWERGYIHPIFYCHFTMHSFAIQYASMIYLTVSVYKMYLLLIFKHSCTGTHTYCSVCLHSLPLKVIQLWQSSLPAATYPPPPKPLGSGRQQSSARFTIPSSLPSQVLVASLKLAKQNCDCAATEIRNDHIIHW